MNDSKKALLIFGGLAAVVIIVVGVMMSKTAFWLVGLLALLGIIIAAAAASDGSQKADAPLREDEILDPDERFGFAFAVKVVVEFITETRSPKRARTGRRCSAKPSRSAVCWMMILTADMSPAHCAGTAIRGSRHCMSSHSTAASATSAGMTCRRSCL